MRRAVRIRRYDTATDASRGRGRRGVMAFLGLWLIVFNVLAATALASGAPSSRGPSFADALGDRIGHLHRRGHGRFRQGRKPGRGALGRAGAALSVLLADAAGRG